jgi:putative GTP pyrophosphokinase
MDYPEETQIRKEAEEIAKVFSRTKEFQELMTLYRCAIMEIETKLNVLNEEFSLQYDRNPFESIETRLKSPTSIVEKMMLHGVDINVENMEGEIFDIAGIRVVCSFKEDIYRLADLLVQQDDVLLLARKDYIENPKPNGYRSLHLIVEIPVFFADATRPMRVEVQIRTIAMDFWASLDHHLRYKKNVKDADSISAELKSCADIIAQTDEDMLRIRKRIFSDHQVLERKNLWAEIDDIN